MALLDPEHLHHLIAEVVDDFDRDAATRWFVEGTRGVAAEAFPCVFVDPGFEGCLERLVGVVCAEEIGVSDEEALFVVVGVEEPTRDAFSPIATDFAGVGMEEIESEYPKKNYSPKASALGNRLKLKGVSVWCNSHDHGDSGTIPVFSETFPVVREEYNYGANRRIGAPSFFHRLEGPIFPGKKLPTNSNLYLEVCRHNPRLSSSMSEEDRSLWEPRTVLFFPKKWTSTCREREDGP